MGDKSKLEEVPKWDVAIAALVKEEFEQNKKGLNKADLNQLASDHSIRFDDIMVTMCSLVENGVWSYDNLKGDTLENLVELFENGRLSQPNADKFVGTWHLK